MLYTIQSVLGNIKPITWQYFGIGMVTCVTATAVEERINCGNVSGHTVAHDPS